jgi:hypothetical protein
VVALAHWTRTRRLYRVQSLAVVLGLAFLAVRAGLTTLPSSHASEPEPKILPLSGHVCTHGRLCNSHSPPGASSPEVRLLGIGELTVAAHWRAHGTAPGRCRENWVSVALISQTAFRGTCHCRYELRVLRCQTASKPRCR